MKPHLWFVRAMSRLVPRRWRSDWMHEWDAELKHRESLGRSDLFRRSLGSFRDALAMQPRRLEDEVLQDVRYGMRMMLKNKFVTAIAVLSLGIGIGANTAVFSAANAVMFRTLPVNRPEELVRFEWVNGPGLMVAAHSGTGYTDSAGRNIRTSFSALTFERFRAHTRALSSLAGYQSVSTMNISIDGNAQVASGLLVSGSYYRTLGLQPLIGRTVTEEDDRPDASPVVVLNYRYWERAIRLAPKRGRVPSQALARKFSRTKIFRLLKATGLSTNAIAFKLSMPETNHGVVQAGTSQIQAGGSIPASLQSSSAVAAASASRRSSDAAKGSSSAFGSRR